MEGELLGAADEVFRSVKLEQQPAQISSVEQHLITSAQVCSLDARKFELSSPIPSAARRSSEF